MRVNTYWNNQIELAMSDANNCHNKTDEEKLLDVEKVISIFQAGVTNGWVGSEIGDKMITFLLSHGKHDEAKAIAVPAQQEIKRLLDPMITPNDPNLNRVVTNNPYSWAGPSIVWFGDASEVEIFSATASSGPCR